MKKRRLSKTFVLFCCGFFFYCTWSMSVSILLSSASGSFGGFSNTVWLTSNIATTITCVLAFVLSKRFDRLLTRRASLPIGAALVLVSGVFLVWGLEISSRDLCCMASALVSLANCFLVFSWGAGFACLREDWQCKVAAFVSVVLSTGAYQILSMITDHLYLLAAAAVGAALVSLFFRGLVFRATKGASLGRRKGKAGKGVGLALLLFIFAASVPMNFLTSITGSRAFDMNVVIGITSLVVFAAALLELVAYRLRTTFVPLLTMLFFTGAMALVILGDTSNLAFAVSSYAGFYLFLPMIYYELGGLVQRGAPSPTRVFALGLLPNTAAVLLGSVLSVCVQKFGYDLTTLIILLVMYGIIGWTFVFVPNKAYRLFTAKTPSEIERDTNIYLEAIGIGCRELARRYRLTAREEEVAGLLVRGRSMTAIADMLKVSLNTVKTHVSHVYTKCSVNSREALIELFEGAVAASGSDGKMPKVEIGS